MDAKRFLVDFKAYFLVFMVYIEIEEGYIGGGVRKDVYFFH